MEARVLLVLLGIHPLSRPQVTPAVQPKLKTVRVVEGAGRAAPVIKPRKRGGAEEAQEGGAEMA
jgi:hypothetical protein